MNVNERSSYTEISTGTICPRCDSVAALYALQNSMMLTPCWPSAGPTGGAGFAAPAWICSLMTAASFFDLGGILLLFSWTCLVDWLELGYLAERQLDRGLAAEDRDQHLQLLVHGVDVADRGGKGGERTVHDRDRLADREVYELDLRLLRRGRAAAATDRGRLLGRRRKDLDDLVQRERRRTRRGADESGDARRVADGPPRLVVELHAHEDVAGEHLALDLLALAVLDLDDVDGRHLDLEDVLLHVQALDAALQVGLHLVLVAGVGVHHVPVAERRAQLAAQRLDRILVLVGRGVLRRGVVGRFGRHLQSFGDLSDFGDVAVANLGRRCRLR